MARPKLSSAASVSPDSAAAMPRSSSSAASASSSGDGPPAGTATAPPAQPRRPCGSRPGRLPRPGQHSPLRRSQGEGAPAGVEGKEGPRLCAGSGQRSWEAASGTSAAPPPACRDASAPCPRLSLGVGVVCAPFCPGAAPACARPPVRLTFLWRGQWGLLLLLFFHGSVPKGYVWVEEALQDGPGIGSSHPERRWQLVGQGTLKGLTPSREAAGGGAGPQTSNSSAGGERPMLCW